MNSWSMSRAVPAKRLWAFIATCAAAALPTATTAVPYVPADDQQIVERLPYTPSDPTTRELRRLREQLRREPENLKLAVRLARRYIEAGRITADPRYAGYAQAALGPWWDLKAPPVEVLVLRATLLQRMHDFRAALADLDTVLKSHPYAAQARLTRATVLQVQGFYDRAKEECLALRALVDELVWAACLANVTSLNGDLRASHDRLRTVLQRHPDADADTRSWVLTMLAEMAARAGMPEAAEQHFRAALAVGGADSYLLGAYSDFLLDAGRPAEVAALLKDKTRADALLLRYALELEALRSKDLPAQVEQLRARFEASRLRGDRVHLREEARFTLHLLGDATTAANLARENWRVQREPADAQILFEAALAARDESALDTLRGWLARTRLEDVHLRGLVAPSVRPVASSSRTQL